MVTASQSYYYAEVSNHTLLSRNEERETLIAAQNGDQAALDKIVRHNQRLVMSIASKYNDTGLGGDQEWTDLVQWGNIGLLKAIEKWDASRGLAFSTYAVWWIKQSIRRFGLAKGSTVHMSYGDSEILARSLKARSVFLLVNHREPTIEELAKEVGKPADMMRALFIAHASTIRLDADRRDGDDRDGYENVDCRDISTEDQAESRVTASLVREQIEKLPYQWKKVIEWRFGFTPTGKLTYQEIGCRMGVSRTRVQQIECVALARLRCYFGSESPL